MEINNEKYPKSITIEGTPSELFALLNSAINGLSKSIETFESDKLFKEAKSELIQRRNVYIELVSNVLLK